MKPLDEIVEPFKKRLEKTEYKIGKTDVQCSPDLYLFMKWAYRVGKGWYGFALGNDVPMLWALIIDEFLDELSKEAPDFQIHQIKLKFGGLRFYVDLRLEDTEKAKAINEEIAKLNALLFNKALIY
jgi:hypothetical protein